VLSLFAKKNPKGLTQLIQRDPDYQLVNQQVQNLLELIQKNPQVVAVLNQPQQQVRSIITQLELNQREQLATFLGKVLYCLKPFTGEQHPNGQIILNLPILPQEFLDTLTTVIREFKKKLTSRQQKLIKNQLSPSPPPSITGGSLQIISGDEGGGVITTSSSPHPPPPPPPPPPSSSDPSPQPSGPPSTSQGQNSQLEAIDQSILKKIRQLQKLRDQGLSSKNKSQTLATIKQSARQLYTALRNDAQNAKNRFQNKRFIKRIKQIQHVYQNIKNIDTNQLGAGGEQSFPLPNPPPSPSTDPVLPTPPTLASSKTPQILAPTLSNDLNDIEVQPLSVAKPDSAPGPGPGPGPGHDGAPVPGPGPGPGHGGAPTPAPVPAPGDNHGDGDAPGQIPLCTPQESSPSTTPMIPILLGVAAVLLGVVNTTIG